MGLMRMEVEDLLGMSGPHADRTSRGRATSVDAVARVRGRRVSFMATT